MAQLESERAFDPSLFDVARKLQAVRSGQPLQSLKRELLEAFRLPDKTKFFFRAHRLGEEYSYQIKQGEERIEFHGAILHTFWKAPPMFANRGELLNSPPPDVGFIPVVLLSDRKEGRFLVLGEASRKPYVTVPLAQFSKLSEKEVEKLFSYVLTQTSISVSLMRHASDVDCKRSVEGPCLR